MSKKVKKLKKRVKELFQFVSSLSSSIDRGKEVVNGILDRDEREDRRKPDAIAADRLSHKQDTDTPSAFARQN